MTTNTDKLLKEREKTHGKFSDHARYTQRLKNVMHDEEDAANPGWGKLNVMQREALDMIVHKIGRILAGDPNDADHWEDIAGYAKLPVMFSEEA